VSSAPAARPLTWNLSPAAEPGGRPGRWPGGRRWLGRREFSRTVPDTPRVVRFVLGQRRLQGPTCGAPRHAELLALRQQWFVTGAGPAPRRPERIAHGRGWHAKPRAGGSPGGGEQCAIERRCHPGCRAALARRPERNAYEHGPDNGTAATGSGKAAGPDGSADFRYCAACGYAQEAG